VYYDGITYGLAIELFPCQRRPKHNPKYVSFRAMHRVEILSTAQPSRSCRADTVQNLSCHVVHRVMPKCRTSCSSHIERQAPALALTATKVVVQQAGAATLAVQVCLKERSPCLSRRPGLRSSHSSSCRRLHKRTRGQVL
jgi:hypothetical protein